MSEIVSKTVKGQHSFRAKQQSYRATSITPALSSKGGREKGKVKEQGDNNNNDRLMVTIPPSAPIITPSTSASASPFLGSKCKFSALDANDCSMQSISSSRKSSKLVPRSSIVAMDHMADSIVDMTSSIRDIASDRRVHQIHAVQAPEPLAPSGSRRRQQILECFQTTETVSDPNGMIAILDLISHDEAAADTYWTLQQEDYCKAWISKRLKELGFPAGDEDQ